MSVISYSNDGRSRTVITAITWIFVRGEYRLLCQPAAEGRLARLHTDREIYRVNGRRHLCYLWECGKIRLDPGTSSRRMTHGGPAAGIAHWIPEIIRVSWSCKLFLYLIALRHLAQRSRRGKPDTKHASYYR